MILRKPYAILIKNFKVIHFIMAIMMGYLVYRTNILYGFLKDYLSDIATTITSDVTSSIFSPLMYFIIILILVGSSIILALMKFKDKPVKLYIFNIITNILLFIFYIVSFRIIKSLESGLVDVRTLKIINDLSFTLLVVQIIVFILFLIRATGFDIKSFDFKRDLEELDIAEEDSEEFEVAVDFDSNKTKRNFNKKIRYFKYNYFENRLLINLVIGFIIFTITLLLCLNYFVFNKTYKLNEYVKTSQYLLNFKNSYHTKYDTNKNIIEKGYELVVVKFQINYLYNDEASLNVGNFYLTVNGRRYHHNLKYKDTVGDIGTAYNNQKLNNEKNIYLLTFLVPESKVNEKMILTYNDYMKKRNIIVNPTNLNNDKVVKTKSLNEELNFKDSILDDSSFKLTSFELSNEFNLNYKYCIKDECFDYIEKLVPTANNNEKTVLMKLSGELNLKDNNKKINNVYKFIDTFGKIKYQKNGELKTMNTKLKQIKPTKTKTSDYYIETDSDLVDSDNIYIEFNIRGKIYKYNVK